MQSKQILSKEKAQELVVKLNDLNKNFKEVENKFKEETSKIKNQLKDYFSLENINSNKFLYKAGKYKNNPTGFSAILVSPTKIIFDADKLEKKLKSKLGKDKLSLIISKKFIIDDFDGLIEYLKTCGVDAKKFKEFISVEKTVNNKKIDELSKIGEIDEEDVSGCYQVKTSESYFKITEGINIDADDEGE